MPSVKRKPDECYSVVSLTVVRCQLSCRCSVQLCKCVCMSLGLLHLSNHLYGEHQYLSMHVVHRVGGQLHLLLSIRCVRPCCILTGLSYMTVSCCMAVHVNMGVDCKRQLTFAQDHNAEAAIVMCLSVLLLVVSTGGICATYWWSV